jgi:hypothetical protein
MDENTIIIWLLFSLIWTSLGYLIGKSKNRTSDGVILGLCLGAIGVIIALCLSEKK